MLQKKLFVFMHLRETTANGNHFTFREELPVSVCTYNVSHDAQLMKRGLPVEQNYVTIYKVSLHNVTELQFLGHLSSVSIFQKSYIVTCNNGVGRNNVRKTDN